MTKKKILPAQLSTRERNRKEACTPNTQLKPTILHCAVSITDLLHYNDQYMFSTPQHASLASRLIFLLLMTEVLRIQAMQRLYFPLNQEQ